MDWFQGPFPTEEQMQVELVAYLSVSHGTKKHIKSTRRQLIRLWKRSKELPFTDVWPRLSGLKLPTEKGLVVGAALKSAFRKRLLQQQGGRCCYCRRWLVSAAHGKPIEHILPRSSFPQYAIEYWNLAVACSDCNDAKTNDVWEGVEVHCADYPSPDSFVGSYHPRFHRYDEHIRYTRIETNRSSVVWFAGITPQGEQLCSKLLYKIAAKEGLINNNPQLARSMANIRGFEEHATKNGLEAFEAFRKALDASLLRLVS